MGYRVLYFLGVGVVNVLYGMLDFGMMLMNDVFEDVCCIIVVMDFLFLVDIDMGWGGVFNIVCIVCEFIVVGIVVVYIED